MSNSRKMGIGIILFVATIQGIVATSLQVEQASEAVTIKLYRMDVGAWSSKAPDVASHISGQANAYCENSLSSCGLTIWNPAVTFNISSVIMTPEAEGKDLEVAVSIVLPEGANVSSVSQTQFVLNKVVTKAIITNVRASLEQSLGAYITYIGEEYYGIPPANLANRAIIPIAFVILIAVIVTAVALHVWNKRKNRRKHHKKTEIAASKVTPVRSMQGAPGKTIDTHHNLKGSNVNNTEKEAHQMQKVAPSTVFNSKQPHTASVNEFREVDETNRHNATNALPPLTAEDDSEHRKDKKRKKRKKKRRHRDSEDKGNDPNVSDTEKSRKESSKSQEHTNPAYDDQLDYWDSDPS